MELKVVFQYSSPADGWLCDILDNNHSYIDTNSVVQYESITVEVVARDKSRPYHSLNKALAIGQKNFFLKLKK